MSQNLLTFGSLSFLGILGALALAARYLPLRSRFSPSARGRSVAVRETLALDPKRRLHLIDWENGSVLLLTGGAQDIVLGRAQRK